MAQNNAEKKPLSVTQIVCWFDLMNGVPATQTAKSTGISRNTVAKYQKEVSDYVGSQIDIDDYRLALDKLRPLAFRSLAVNLFNCKEQTTIAFNKGIGAFVERTESDEVSNLSDDKLDELRKSIIGRLDKRTAKAPKDS